MKTNSGWFTASSIRESFILGNSLEKYYFMGLMASDGNVKDDRMFSISQSGKNGRLLINYLIEKLNYKNKIYVNKNAHAISVTSVVCVNELKKFGIVPRKTYTYDLPFTINNNNFRAFFRGYIDGDGCVGVYNNNRNSKYLTISVVGTKAFIYNCFRLLNSGHIYKIKRCKNLYELKWNGKEAVSFCSWLFQDKKLFKSHKYNIFKEYMLNRDDKFTKYVNIKKICRDLYFNEMNANQIWHDINKKVAFQTIYKWKNNGFI